MQGRKSGKSKPEAERLSGMVEKTGTAESEAETGLEGQDRASATKFSEPGMWTISLVNLEI